MYLLMALTKSAAEGCRMRSRKSCHVSGAVDVPNMSAFSILLSPESGSDRRTEILTTMREERES